MRRRSRLGFTALEMLVALTLGLLVLHLGLVTVERVRSAHRRVAERADVLTSLRIGRLVPRQELRLGVAGRDWAAGPDSVALRAFRGLGVVCAGGAIGDSLVVWLRAARLPEPDKDSVLVVSADGRTEVARVRAVERTGPACGRRPAPATVLRLDRPAPADALLARLFERGSYHLTGSALRYRRGAGGRQPLTPEAWATPGSSWLPAASSVGVRYVPRRSGVGAGWSGFVAWTRP